MHHNDRNDNSRLLRTALRANAAFSVASGVAMAGLSQPLAEWTGLPSGLVFWVGVVVALNAIPMTVQSFQAAIPRNLTLATIAGDVVWVIASVVIVALRPWDLTVAGVAVILGVAAAVGAFAWAQTVGVRRYWPVRA